MTRSSVSGQRSPHFFETKTEAQVYLGAMIDGEGCVGRTRSNRCVSISNKDIDNLAAIRGALDKLGVSYKLYTNRKSNGVFNVTVRGYTNLRYLLENVPIRCGYKHERLVDLVAVLEQSPQDKVRRMDITEAELRRLHHGEMLSLGQIAEQYGVHLSTIQYRMKKYGIQTRSRAEALRMSWENGKRRDACQPSREEVKRQRASMPSLLRDAAQE